MSLPKELIEHNVYFPLENCKNIELMILKGHLALELLMSSIVPDKNKSFYRKSTFIQNIDELEFIFTSPTFIEDKFQKISREFYIPHIVNESQLCGGDFELRLKNELNQKAIAKECSTWIKEKVTFKSNKQNNLPLNGLINIEKGEQSVSYSNITGFTSSDLGVTHKQGFPTLIQKSVFLLDILY